MTTATETRLRSRNAKRRCGLPVLLGYVTVLLAAAACQTNVQEGIESANELLYEKKYVESERLYRKLLKRLENHRDLDEDQEAQQLLILDRLGKINALYLHDYNQALADYDVLVRRYPKTDQAFAARAMVADIQHHKLGNLQAAVDEYQRLVSEFPGRPETKRPQLKIVAAYFQLKNYEQARTEAETLINRWPDSPEAEQARIQIANSYYVEGRYTEAIATYERLLEDKLEPSMRALVLFELGNCFQELGEPDRALAYFYECLADHPNPALVQRKIRRIRTRLSKVRPAERIHGTQRRIPHPAGPAEAVAQATEEGDPPAPRRRRRPPPPPQEPTDTEARDDANDDADGLQPPAPPAAAAPEARPAPKKERPKNKEITAPPETPPAAPATAEGAGDGAPTEAKPKTQATEPQTADTAAEAEP